MKNSEILIAGKALIDAPEKWTKECSARNADGTPATSVRDANNKLSFPTATSYCSFGAVCTAKGSGFADLSAWRFLKVPENFDSAISFNDHSTTTHADVMRMFDEAIVAAQADEAIH